MLKKREFKGCSLMGRLILKENPKLGLCYSCQEDAFEAMPGHYTLSPVNEGEQIELIVWVCKNCGHVMTFTA